MAQQKKSLVVLLIVASVCLVVAVGFAINTTLFLRTAVRTTGTVVELRSRARVGDRTTYAPIFKFRDVAGNEHRIESNVSQRPCPYSVGMTVPVLYRADDPNSALIDRFWELWILPVVLGIVGAVTKTFSVVNLVRR